MLIQVSRRALVVLLAGALLLQACATSDPAVAPAGAANEAANEAANTPTTAAVTVDNCGVEVASEPAPERVFAMNTGALENLLALGMQDRIVGAVGRSDDLREDLRAAADEVAIIHPGGADYPSPEAVLETEPDFIYSVYPSAFRADGGLATREELAALDVRTYLAPVRCPDRDADRPLTIEEIWGELAEVGALLGVADRAEEVVHAQRDAIAAVRAGLPDVDHLEVFWWDMGTSEGPTAGACCGAPGMILRELGLANAFEDLPGHWATTSWEQVVERDPDLVVVADFGDDDIATKLGFVTGDPTLRELRAFRDDAVVVVPLSQTTPGLQNLAGIEAIGAFLAERVDDR